MAAAQMGTLQHQVLWGEVALSAPATRTGMAAALMEYRLPRVQTTLDAHNITVTFKRDKIIPLQPLQQQARPCPSSAPWASAAAPCTAAVLTTSPQPWVLEGKDVSIGPTIRTLSCACCPAPTAPAPTGQLAGTLWELLASATGFGMAAVRATKTALPRRRSA